MLKNLIMENKKEMKKVNNQYIDRLVKKFINENINDKADEIMSQINELGGMDDGHPRFGKINFAKLSDKELEDLLKQPMDNVQVDFNDDFGLITGLTFNDDKYNLAKELEDGDLKGLSIYDEFFKDRGFTLKYTDEDGALKEAKLDGMMSRIVQHEYDHMLGRNFTEKASKLKIDAAMKKRDKMLKRIKKYQEAEAKMNKA
mgnify:CR=1 FL=1